MTGPRSQPRMSALRRLAIAAAALAVFAACGWFTWGKGYYQAMQPTITRQQAIDRVEQLIQQTVAQLPPDARLDPLGRSSGSPCDDPTDGGPKGRVFVESTYWVKDLPRENYPQYLDTVERYWADRGYRLIRDTMHGPIDRSIVYSDAEGFRIVLETNDDGKAISVSSQSPCVWPNGAPDPR